MEFHFEIGMVDLCDMRVVLIILIIFQQIHPETEKHHGHGLVLENHTSEKHHEHHHHKEHHEEPEVHHDFGVHEAPQHEPHINLHHQQLKQHDDGDGYGDESSHHQFHDINVHHGHYE